MHKAQGSPKRRDARAQEADEAAEQGSREGDTEHRAFTLSCPVVRKLRSHPEGLSKHEPHLVSVTKPLLVPGRSSFFNVLPGGAKKGMSAPSD